MIIDTEDLIAFFHLLYEPTNQVTKTLLSYKYLLPQSRMFSYKEAQNFKKVRMSIKLCSNFKPNPVVEKLSICHRVQRIRQIRPTKNMKRTKIQHKEKKR
ncbi:hypothetical protein J1N35_037596 [Gossypium stocksii]|uniref:Uncharacterized protein n=1 Tax=Gossypium stocksii TaxID=47602 RepID=A0A9D3UKB1_9ROSI|nr:hypothetical protein J1N35_037596 [Gossypium stocksii]